MRKSCIYLISLCCAGNSFAAIITWDGGGGDGLWATAANWVGNIVPGPGDDVILDNAVVLATYTVTLPGGAVTTTVSTLTITPSAANNITLTLPNSNTANPGLSVTGMGDGLVLNNGAVLKNSSLAIAGSGVSITNSFRINNGGHYIHNTGRGNAAIVSQLSIAAGTELGEFEFDIPDLGGSYILSLSGRTFGSLTLSGLSGTNITYIGSGSMILTVRGNLRIANTARLSISLSADIQVQGSCFVGSNSVFNLQTSGNNNLVRVRGHVTSNGSITESGTGLPVLELNGSSNQNLLIAGGILSDVTLKINNPAGILVITTFSLAYKLQLTNGKLNTASPARVLVMEAGSSVIGGSNLSFVEGPVRKRGNTDFIFPVGAGSIYAPIGIGNVSGEDPSDAFTAKYIRVDPRSVYGVNYQSPIDHVSMVEYWSLLQSSGTATKKIALAVNPESFATNLNTLLVARYNTGDGEWKNEGLNTVVAGPPFPPYVTGSITGNAVSNFGIFTLATTDPPGINPLPLNLLNFDAVKVGHTAAAVKWELAACCAGKIWFDVQKSTGDRNFKTFAQLPGSASNRYYELSDDQLGPGVTNYRLKIIDANGKLSYSKIVAVINAHPAISITSLFPNPVNRQVTFTVSSGRAGKGRFVIYNMNGIAVKQWEADLGEGNTVLTMHAGELPAGLYQMVALVPGGRSVLGFAKQ